MKDYIGKWIPNLATITEPLRKLLRMKLGTQANIQQHWKEQQQLPFGNLKNTFSTINNLGYYNSKHRTREIAVPVGLGCVHI